MPVATDSHLLLLATQRAVAERLLNAVRGGVLPLAIAASSSTARPERNLSAT